MQLQVSLLVCVCHVSKRDYDASAIEKAVDTLDPHNGILYANYVRSHSSP